MQSALSRLTHRNGQIIKIFREDQDQFNCGELYVSHIQGMVIRAWKKHLKLTSLLIAIKGKFQVVLVENGVYKKYSLTDDLSTKLIIRPGTWYGFQSKLKEGGMILAALDAPHDPGEQVSAPIEQFDYKWDS